jgi:hypothetical protein
MAKIRFACDPSAVGPRQGVVGLHTPSSITDRDEWPMRRVLSAVGGAWRSLAAAAVPSPGAIRSAAMRTVLRLLRHPLTPSLPSIFVLSLLSFRHNAPYLFYGLDGRYEVSLIASSSILVPPLLGYTGDFLHGLGNVWFSVNPRFIPAYFLSLSGPGDFSDFPLTYAICATELFLATFAAGRLLCAPRFAALVAAWMVPLLTFQYVDWNLIPSTFRAFPHYATIADVASLVTAMLLLIGQLSLARAAIAAGLSFAGISYIVVVAPTLLILAAPQFIIAAVVSLIAARGRRRLMVRVALMAAIPLACATLGYASFLLGLAADSAANFFQNLSVRPGGLGEASMLFWSAATPVFFTAERTFILLGLIGGVSTALLTRGILRIAAIAFLLTEGLYIAVGVVHAYHPFWFGPAPWYFEGFLFPFHAIFAATLLSAPAAIARRLWRAQGPSASLRYRRAAMVVLTIAVAIAPWFYVRDRQQRAGMPDLAYYEPHPQPETAITRILKNEIALKPGAPFRGREATLTGRIFPLSTSVDFLGLSAMPDILAMQTTGNLHSFAGLWQDLVPTLVEYNPLMTPAYFVFGRTFFTEPADRQIRNVLAMRRIDLRMLALVGVRFIVTDAPVEGAVRLRQTLAVPVTQEMLERLGMRRPIPSFDLYLYELDRVNLGQYSPTEFRHAATASEMLEVLAEPSLDPASTAVTSEPLPNSLTHARLDAFEVEAGHFRVKASSEGWSLLVLPLEFSRCFRLDHKVGTAAEARLIRVDLLMTGIVFSKELDARLSYHTGPFVNSRCRLSDAEDMKTVKIGDAFRHRQDLAPIPIAHY